MDPDAAAVVFDSSPEVATKAMIPLEVTHTAVPPTDIMARIGQGSELRKACTSLLDFFWQTHSESFGFALPPLHDPCALFYALQPWQFTSSFARVNVERCSPLTLGQTGALGPCECSECSITLSFFDVDLFCSVCDWKKEGDNGANCLVATEMNNEAMWPTLLSDIAAIEGR